jgi:hypothetical protein
MIYTITYKGIKLDCKVHITVTRDPLGTLSTIGRASPTEYDVDYDWISLQNNSTEDLMPMLEHDLDKITDLVLESYREI